MNPRFRTPTIFFVLLLAAGTGAAQVLTRVSDASGGGAGNAESRLRISRWPISADGRFVAFTSDATDLVPDDTNGLADVFVRDLELGTTTRLSVDVNGGDADGASADPSISADHRFVAFVSSATDLVDGDDNDVDDIFVRDLHRGTTIRVNVGIGGGEANDYSTRPSISGDGRMVTFGSHATNLVVNDGNGMGDVFVRDTTLEETSRVSVDLNGGDPDSGSWGSTISADGRFIAYSSNATNLTTDPDTGFRDVFVRDLDAGRTMKASVGRNGNEADSGAIGPSLSDHGRFVSFRSDATDLVAGDTNGQDDIFVRDLIRTTTTRVNVSSDGEQTVGAGSYHAAVNGDGRYVVFMSDAANLVPGDTNGWGDVFAHDRATGTTVLLSNSSSGEQGNGFSRWPVITADGALVAIESLASNFVAGDTNEATDVFVATGPAALSTYVRICPGAASAPGVGASFWVTDLRLFNPDPDETITVWLSALIRDADNSGAPELPVTVAARGGVALDDIIATTFGLAETTAAIRMRSQAPFLATSRTFNIGGEAGTYGSFIPAFGPEGALDQGMILHVINQPGEPGFRSNVGFANPGLNAVTVTVLVFDADDRTLIGSGRLDLAPRSFSQINDVFEYVGREDQVVTNATVEFTADAPILAYASVIDNESGDSIFVVPSADQGTPLP